MKLSFYLENVYDADLFLEKGSLMIFFKCTSSETEMKKSFIEINLCSYVV